MVNLGWALTAAAIVSIVIAGTAVFVRSQLG
jgi:hypothetical protein